MKNVRLAIIDMGTNTFHLLVVEYRDRKWSEIYRERVFVNLAEDGIDHIGEQAWARGQQAIRNFSQHIISEGVEHVRAVGTAALRKATNSDAFRSMIETEYGIVVEVIDGVTEADLISKGVIAAAQPANPSLIMDIGGGSVEFIIVENGQPTFSGSYPMGVAVLYDKFHKNEPITVQELADIDAFLDDMLIPLYQAMERAPGLELIGASGSFEVLDRALHRNLLENAFVVYPIEDFTNFYEGIVPLDLDQRLAHPDIPPERAHYVVCALHLIRYITDRMGVRSMGISSYAMKEGIAEDFLQYLD